MEQSNIGIVIKTNGFFSGVTLVDSTQEFTFANPNYCFTPELPNSNLQQLIIASDKGKAWSLINEREICVDNEGDGTIVVSVGVSYNSVTNWIILKIGGQGWAEVKSKYGNARHIEGTYLWVVPSSETAGKKLESMSNEELATITSSLKVNV